MTSLNVVSWNLTYRCNLACEHCYLDAGAKKFQILKDESFSDRSELSTEECYAVIDQLSEFAPEAVTILTGGEPLLRRDILEIIRYGHSKSLWMVIGTNGIYITESLARTLKDAGIRGFALSLDALNPVRHDHFRRVKGAWENTVKGAKVLDRAGMPFIVQTTVGSHNLKEISKIADFAHEEMGARVFNLYFLVPSGRGQFVSDLSREDYEEVLSTLSKIQKKYDGRMLTNAKCAPHYTRYLFENDRDSKFLKSFSGGSGGCPAGSQYMGIRPNGDLTPCPYLPEYAGNLMHSRLEDLWKNSELFQKIRARNDLGGRCGSCEFAGRCGGCRARAYMATGNLLAEDPLCEYEPGKYVRADVERSFGVMEYDLPGGTSVVWEADAEARMKEIPKFVRGMVRRSVENYCKKNGIQRVSAETMREIRARMPTPKVFQKMKERELK